VRVTVKEAAERMGVSQQFVRIGLQRGLLPIGTAVKMSSVWTYHISPGLLEQYLGGKQKAAPPAGTGETADAKGVLYEE